jgi:hypothetical protein
MVLPFEAYKMLPETNQPDSFCLIRILNVREIQPACCLTLLPLFILLRKNPYYCEPSLSATVIIYFNHSFSSSFREFISVG